jgi:hypothetical protein
MRTLDNGEQKKMILFALPVLVGMIHSALSQDYMNSLSPPSTDAVNDPTVGPMTIAPPGSCETQAECEQMAMPCEVRTCDTKASECMFERLRMNGELCVGVVVEGDQECHCDGKLPQCTCVSFSSPSSVATSETTSTDTSVLTTATTTTFGPTMQSPSSTPEGEPQASTTPASTSPLTSISLWTGTDDGSDATMPTTTADGETDDDDQRTRAGTGTTTVARLIAPPQTGTTSSKQAMPKATATGTEVDDISQSIHSTDEKPPIEIIVGAVVGCIASLGLIAAIAYFVSRRSRDSSPTTPIAIQSTSSPSSSSVLTVTTTPMTYSQAPSGTSEYGAAPVFPPSGEYGIAPPAQPYDAPPSQIFAEYESVRDPLQL